MITPRSSRPCPRPRSRSPGTSRRRWCCRRCRARACRCSSSTTRSTTCGSSQPCGRRPSRPSAEPATLSTPKGDPMKSPAELWQEIEETEVSGGTLAFWWLYQAGIVLKSPGGTVLVVDPYLSESVLRSYQLPRGVPAPLDPAGTEVAALLATHSHEDHLDPDSIEPFLRPAGIRFIAGTSAGETYYSQLGYPVIPEGDLADAAVREPDVLIVPGGDAGQRLAASGAFADLVRAQAARGAVVAVVGDRGDLDATISCATPDDL